MISPTAPGPWGAGTRPRGAFESARSHRPEYYNAILLGSEIEQFGIRCWPQAGGVHIQDIDGGFASLQAATQVSVDVFVRQEADAQGCLAGICLRASRRANSSGLVWLNGGLARSRSRWRGRLSFTVCSCSR